MSPRSARLAGKRPEGSINAQRKLGIKERKYLMSKKLITACMAMFALAAFALPAIASASPQITHPTGTRLNPETGECTGVTKTICITATNVGNTKLKTDPSGTTAPSTLTECTKAVMTAYLLKNTGTEIEATIHTATFEGTGSALTGTGMHECAGSSGILGNLSPTTNGGGVDGENVTNGTPWCLKANSKMSPDEFQLFGGDCGGTATKIRFILDTTKLFEPTKDIECKYERAATEPIRGTFTTDETGDAILSVTPGTSEAEKARTTFKGEAGNSIECPATGTLEMSFTLETDTTEKNDPIYIS